MKRKSKKPGLKFRKPKTRDNFSKEQLEAIGAVAMSYNDAEAELNEIVGSAFNLAPKLWNDLATRINGAAGKRELINLAIKSQKWPDPVISRIEDTLGAFIEWKGYRDSIIHAKMADKANAIGYPLQRQGSQGEVLLSAKAVEGVYERIIIVIEELRCLRTLTEALSADKFINGQGKLDQFDHQKFVQERAKRLEPKCREYLSQVEKLQKSRRSLSPLPKFPTPKVARVNFGGGKIMKLPFYSE